MFNKIRYILTFLIVSLIIIFFNNTAFSQVVINEIMSGPNTDGLDFNVSSTNANSLYNFLPDDQPPYNREWIELYNMNPCDSADISCYMLGCNEYDKSSDQPNWGVFIFPQGTKIPPMGYIVIGGNASQVKKIDFNLHDYINTPYLDGFPDRWFLRDAYGWLALYNPSGNVVDAVFWSQGDNPPYSTGKATDILKHSEYSSPITTSKSCSGDITLESALQLYKENKIAFLGNSATGQFATFQRKTDGNIAWYPNSATPTPNANNYKPSSISVSSVNSTCFNSNNGTATVNYNNAPYGLNYTYIWDDPKSQNTKTATNLSPGTYKASIKFTNYSCSFVSTPVTITEPTQLTANISMQDATCGNNNGTATISPSGGTPGYTYTWSNGKTTGSVTGLSGGNYTVTVYDKNKCSVIKSLTINSTNNLQLTVTTTQNSCNGDASGTASVAVVGGSTPYKYSWSTGDTVSKISRLIKGTYSIYITDFKGCKKDTSVIINDPPKLTITQLIKTDILCNGNNTGSIKTTITGGTTPYTYIWSNGKTSADLSNLTAGNYQVTVTDNKGCKTTSVIVNINQPTALKNSISKTDNKCGKSNGSVTLTVTGGTTPYTYTWSNGSKTQNLSNIPAETYTVTIKDNNGCSDLKSITIVSGSDLTVSSPSKTDITCFGKNDGTARAIASGGTLPYTFLWSDKESAATITSLQTGAYTLTVTDAFGCSGTNSVVINQPADILITPSQTNILCNGNKSGAVNIIVTGGTIPYTYLWSNSKTTQNISGLGSGNYSITVTDANSCTKVHSTTITEPSKLSVKIDSTNTTCGFNNGTAKANVTGGTSPYNYLWSNNSTNQNINNLPAGNYKLTVTDKNACSATPKTDIALSSALTLSNPRVINPTCKYANNGSITVFASNGTLPYTYSWSNGEDSSTILNLIPGNYLVTVTDKIGCTGTSQATITEPSKLSVSSINKTDAMCYEEVSGSINITASGGTSPYTYTWSNGSTQNSLSRLKAGDYTVTITDSKECDTIFTVQITQPPAINSSITHSDTKCSLNNGTITVNASGGTPPISYLWSNKSTNNFISGLKAGIYSVTITDGNSCHKILSDTVNSSTNVSIKFTKANITCYGFNNGTANAIVTGGTQPYTYKWSNGKNTSLINNLISGQYFLTVTDADGCKTDSAIYINDVNKLTDSISINNITCNGSVNGSANIYVSGGTIPYSYSWYNGIITASATRLFAGNYSISIIDSNGCRIDTSITITEPSKISLAITGIKNIICDRTGRGSATVVPSGGVMPYSYSWSNGDLNQTNMSMTDGGTYYVTVTDKNHCTAIDSVSIINFSDKFKLRPIQVNITCDSNLTGAATVIVESGAAPPYQYTWSTGQTIQTITGLLAGKYTVTVFDKNNCSGIVHYEITEPQKLITEIQKKDITCHGLADGLATVIIDKGTAPFVFTWSNNSTNQSISKLISTSYTVTVTDSNRCRNIQTFFIIEPAELSGFITKTDLSCFDSINNSSATIHVSGGTAPYYYSWSNDSTTQTIKHLNSGLYSVIVKDTNGCTINNNVQINQPEQLNISLTSKNDIGCNGNSTGSASILASGGTKPYIYSWNTSSQQNSSTINNLPAGNYIITLTDSNKCKSTYTITINEPLKLTIPVLDITTVSCKGKSDGSAIIHANGGTSPYTYKWSDNHTDSIANNLKAGRYHITVTDSNNCLDTVSFDINEPSVLNAQTNSINNVLCNSGGTGSISLKASGGTFPYSYTWSTGDTIQSINNLKAGIYSVTIKDFKGCQYNNSYSISEPPILTINLTAGNVNCFGTNTGYVKSNVSGGTKPFVYNWSNGNNKDSSIINLYSGTYTLTITDKNNCSQSDQISVTEKSPVISAHSTTSVSCNNGNDGTATEVPQGGTPPYSYLWSDNSSNTSIKTKSGTYKVTITDALGCSKIDTGIIISEPQKLALVLDSINNVQCNGSGTGKASVFVSGGTLPYSYNWSQGSLISSANNLIAGKYTVTITDKNKCIISDSLLITQPTAITLSYTIQNALCFNENTGSAKIIAKGGTTPYHYLWSYNGITNQSIDKIHAGTYKVTVSDANMCSKDTIIIITQPDSISISFTSNNASCNKGNNGNIVTKVNGGTLPYKFLWNNSNADTIKDISGLSADTYVLNVTDNNNCTAKKQVKISEPLPIIIYSDSLVKPTCTGKCDGSAKLLIKGGTLPYFYTLDTIINSKLKTQDLKLSGLCSGKYTVTITDINKCTDTLSVVINKPDSFYIKINPNNIINASCKNSCDGQATVEFFNGTSPLTYSWSNGTNQSAVSNLCPGNYSVIVKDGKNCIANTSFTIIQRSNLTISSLSRNVSCFDSCNGSATIISTGGIYPNIYIWNSGNTRDSINRGLCSGIYTVTVYDKIGCNAKTSIKITKPEKLQLSVTSSDNITCAGLCNGSATVLPKGGTGAYRITWSNNQTTYTDLNLCKGDYQVIVKDSNNCQASVNITITSPDSLHLLSHIINPTCPDSCNGSINTSISGGTIPYVYKWDNFQTVSNLTNICAGTYNMTVTDLNGCSTKLNAALITQYSKPVFSIKSDKNSIYRGQSTTLSINNLPDNYSVSWSPETGLSSTTSVNTVASPISTTIYEAIIKDDAHGCVFKDTITINIYEGECKFPYIYVPDAFTPNGDNNNDQLFVHSSNIKELTFSIFDRWGEKIFETTDKNKGWDGIYKGQLLPQGVYIYLLDATCKDSRKYFTKGNITLIRQSSYNK